MRRITITGLALLAVGILNTAAASAFPEFQMLPRGSKFTSTSGAGVLATEGIGEIVCASDNAAGTITSMDSVGNVHIHFAGCVATNFEGAKCTVKSTNSTTEGLILTNTLIGLLGEVGSGSKTGLYLKPEPGTLWLILARAACMGESGIEGALIGEATPIDALQETGLLNYIGATGVQSLKTIKLLSGVTKASLKWSGFVVAENTSEELKFEGAVEVT